MFEYYVEDAVPDFEEAKRQLFRAVIDGEVRARVNGVALGPEELNGSLRSNLTIPIRRLCLLILNCQWKMRGGSGWAREAKGAASE